MNYKQIIENVLKNGQPKEATRLDSNGNVVPVENATIGTFCEIFRHDMGQGFPLSTLRRMPFKPTCVELEGFIKGVTSKQWYKDRNCSYWNYWASPMAVKSFKEDSHSIDNHLGYSIERHKKIQEECDDLGECFYAGSWRGFHDPNGYADESVDQINELVKILKTSPYNRRMVVTSWNPLGTDYTALHWCHHSFTVCVYGNKLNLAWDQRSCDLLINQTIVTYGLLLLLLCEESGLEPGELSGRFIDCHIYENQLDAAKELVKREEKDLPQVKIKRKEDGSFSIFDWTYEDVELINYNPHPKMNMGAVTV